MMYRLTLILILSATAACHRASAPWSDPTASPPTQTPGPELRYEQFYGTWTLDHDQTHDLNGTADRADQRPAVTDPLADGMTFERNGVLLLDRFNRPGVGTWQPQGPDRLLIQRPDASAPDNYTVQFNENLLHLTNRQTGERLVFWRK